MIRNRIVEKVGGIVLAVAFVVAIVWRLIEFFFKK